MSYTSFNYICFIIILCSIYYIIKPKFRWFVLLCGNIIFYINSGWDNFIFLLLGIVISYMIAIKIGKLQSQFKDIKKQGLYDRKELKNIKATYTKKQQRYLKLGLFLVIGILVVVKYTNFILGNVHSFLDLIGVNNEKIVVGMIVPMGISFYTFQIIAYMVDVYNGEKPQQNFFRYALYSSFFPSVVQGPIPRYHNLGKQLYEEHLFNGDRFLSGIILILWGYVKKLVIAENLAVFVNEIYDNYSLYKGVVFIIATGAYSIQIYCDFVGCMDIVTGSARLFGIELQPNFFRPYFSKTMPEFWRRWHASLGTWFKDYVFYPFSISQVSLNLNKKARKTFGNGVGRIVAASMPILIVWSLTGIWHGAEWKYVAWGLFHGLLIILSTIFTPYNEKVTQRLGINKEAFGFKLFQMARTFTLCGIGRVFFRADNLGEAMKIFKQTFATVGIKVIKDINFYEIGISIKDVVLTVLLICILIIVSIIEERADGKCIVDIINTKSNRLKFAIIYVLIFTVLIFGNYGPNYDVSNFIYEQF